MKKALSYRHNLQTLRVYMYYRIAISGLLFVMYYAGIASNVLGVGFETLYLWTSVLYAAQSIITVFVFPAKRLRYSSRRISLLLTVDIVGLLILIHASGGIESGLAYLLIINIAIVTIFIFGRLALAYAAFVAIATLIDTIYLYAGKDDFEKALFTSGSLGILLFATAIFLTFYTRKLRRAGEQADRQNTKLRNLQEIAQNIVTRMQTGIIVIDGDMNIELMNASAKKLLDIPPDRNVYGHVLNEYRDLQPLLIQWKSIAQHNKPSVIKLRHDIETRVNIAQLDNKNIGKTIIYLEDYAIIKQQAQQLKLASLGKLAASIAHEIRNPLGAMSHAAQLLVESDQLANTDKRMADIIINNSKRVNDIVENTLAMSRRKAPSPEKITLDDWLPSFINDYNSSCHSDVKLVMMTSPLYARFDDTHLRQILSNLIDNGRRFSEKDTGIACVSIIAGSVENDDKAYIDVIDTGDGIPEDDEITIFEPFFTTDNKGSGLGLYICKELSEINHASLNYARIDSNKTRFRLHFSHYQRMQ